MEFRTCTKFCTPEFISRKIGAQWSNLNYHFLYNFFCCAFFLLWSLSFSEKRATYLRKNYENFQSLFFSDISKNEYKATIIFIYFSTSASGWKSRKRWWRRREKCTGDELLFSEALYFQFLSSRSRSTVSSCSCRQESWYAFKNTFILSPLTLFSFKSSRNSLLNPYLIQSQ